MTVKLLTEHYLEFLSLKGGYTGSSESTYVKMPHCWKSHVAAHMLLFLIELCQRDGAQRDSSFETPKHKLMDKKDLQLYTLKVC